MPRPERRRHQRFKVRFQCELSLDSGVTEATVRDVSCGGLSVESKCGADQGDTVRVRLDPPGHPPIDVEALVWNVRSGRSRSTGGEMHRLGLVLSEAPPEFEALVRVRTPPAPPKSAPPDPRKPARPAAKKPAEPLRGLPAPEEPLFRYRARVMRTGTSRTRAIMVFATSPDDAREKALLEVGDDWTLLEIGPA